MMYYIDVLKTKQNNAAKKAPADIAEICKEMGMKAISMPTIPYEKSILYQTVWMSTIWFFYLIKMQLQLKKDDILLIQHPLYGTRLLLKILPRIKHKGVKLIAVIHDLNIIRGADEAQGGTLSKSVSIQDTNILKMFDSIICHNQKMLDFLIKAGFEENKLISLEIFDYLYKKDNSIMYTVSEDVQYNGKLPSIAIAGNLSPEKSGYIYKLANHLGNLCNCNLYLYGNGYKEDSLEKNASQFTKYMGSVNPENLPKELKYDFGVVWDGDSIETCSGKTGEYLRFNNPHKTSLYLAAEIPVIIWKKAALSEYVLKNNVGVVVDTLEDIGTFIGSISEGEYKLMKANAIRASQRIRNGYYFKKAFKEAVRRNEV